MRVRADTVRRKSNIKKLGAAWGRLDRHLNEAHAFLDSLLLPLGHSHVCAVAFTPTAPVAVRRAHAASPGVRVVWALMDPGCRQDMAQAIRPLVPAVDLPVRCAARRVRTGRCALRVQRRHCAGVEHTDTARVRVYLLLRPVLSSSRTEAAWLCDRLGTRGSISSFRLLLPLCREPRCSPDAWCSAGDMGPLPGWFSDRTCPARLLFPGCRAAPSLWPGPGGLQRAPGASAGETRRQAAGGRRQAAGRTRSRAARGGGDLLGALPCAAGALPCARPSPARSGSSSPLSERGLKLPPSESLSKSGSELSIRRAALRCSISRPCAAGRAAIARAGRGQRQRQRAPDPGRCAGPHSAPLSAPSLFLPAGS